MSPEQEFNKGHVLEPITAKALSPPFVLVADDDLDMREEIGRALNERGYGVITMKSGDRLVEYLGRCAVYGGQFRVPDVIVCDVRMPGSSGLEVLKIIQELRWRIPVILMTAFGDLELHARAKRLGAIATFNKPFDTDDLCIAIAWARSPRH